MTDEARARGRRLSQTPITRSGASRAEGRRPMTAGRTNPPRSSEGK